MKTFAPPELLSPAGDWDCARAAVANGADAIYFGLDTGFNARARAKNFSPEALPELMAFLHRHNVRGYVTLNTLAFSDELEALESLVRTIAVSGVDAVLVQDLGLARLVRAVSPKLSIHASTQMTMTSAECIDVAASLGIDRVVLARELSVKEIAQIHAGTEMPLEAFVHGALCVAYSGQCLTSESFGGRSANRGQCAQACRLPYELICDGKDVDLGDQKYLLSPQDLAAYALVRELVAAGVMSLKIEGRLKTPEYVANITRHYRQAIDSTMAGRPVEFTPRDIEEMELSFSRGFSVGWLGGCDHKMLVPALSSSKRGVLAGTVQEVRQGRIQVRLSGRLKAGDGVVFEGDRASDDEQGGRLFSVLRNGKPIDGEAETGVVELTFANGTVDPRKLSTGQKFWKTDDPALTKKLRKSFTGEIEGRPVPVTLEVTAAVGQPLTVAVQSPLGEPFTLQSPSALEEARKHPLTHDVLEAQFDRLGGTGFEIAKFGSLVTGAPMAPLSVIGQLRRELVERLQQQRDHQRLPQAEVAPFPVLPRLRQKVWELHKSLPETPALHLLCRSMQQLTTALEAGVKDLYADFQDLREYREAVAASHEKDARIFLATPRIQKPGELGLFKAMHRHGADGYLIRNLSGLQFFLSKNARCIADFSLNAANELTVAWLCGEGVERVTTSYDLNRDQLLAMVSQTPVSRLEVVVHQQMPMFHMEHCVFCAVLSPGTNKTNCGRPCDFHEVKLRDRTGVEHPLKADVGCRNTLFNAVPQSAAEIVPELVKKGLTHFRVELLQDEPADSIHRLIELYRQLLAGEIVGSDVWRELKAANRVGVTRGTLEERRNPLAIL